jgi:hypothetical protein
VAVWPGKVWCGWETKRRRKLMSILMSFVELVLGEPEGWVWVGLEVRYDGTEVRVLGRCILKGSGRWLVTLLL